MPARSPGFGAGRRSRLMGGWRTTPGLLQWCCICCVFLNISQIPRCRVRRESVGSQMLSSMTMASISRSARRSPGAQTLHSGVCGGAGRRSEHDDLCAVVLGEHAEGDRDSADEGVEDLLLTLR